MAKYMAPHVKLLVACLGSGSFVCLAEALLAESDAERLIGFAMLLVAFVWIGGAILLFLMAIDAAREMQFKKGLVAALFPLVFFAVTAASANSDPLQAVRLPILAGDAIHFAANKPAYDRVVRGGSTGVKVFVWAGDIVGEDGIAHDESGELTRTGDLARLCDATPLWDHYYFVRFGC